MRKTLVVFLAAALLFPLTLAFGQQAAPPPPSEGRHDACKLLDSNDIQKVQGDAVKQAKPTQRTAGGVLVSQCFFETTKYANSVTLMLTSPSPAMPSINPKDLWRKQFAPDDEDHEATKGATSGEEKEEKHQPPKRIESLGDEAYWVGGTVGGALYVLHGNSFVRISVGGLRDDSARLARCASLAEQVLKRL